MKYLFLFTIGFTVTLQAQPEVNHATHKVGEYQRSFLAHYNVCVGDYQEAQKQFTALLEQSVPFAVYRGYVEYLLEMQKFQEIVALSKAKSYLFDKPAVQEIDPYRQHKMTFMLAQALEGVGATEQAMKQLLALTKLLPHNHEIIYQTVKVLMRVGDNARALDLLNNLLKENNEARNNYIFYFLKYGILCDLEDFSKAKKSLQKALKLQPQFEQGWLFLGVINEHLGSVDQAIEGYQRFIDLVGRDLLIEQKLMRLKLVHFWSRTTVFSQAQEAYAKKEYARALSLLEKCLQQGYSIEDVHLLKIDTLAALKQWKELRSYIEEHVSVHYNNEFWLRVAYMTYLADPKKNKQLGELFITLQKKHPRSERLGLYALDCALRLDNTMQALQLGNHILSLVKDSVVEAKVIFQLCSLYYNQKRFKDIRSLLERQVVSVTSYSPLLNFAAYYYATKGHSIEKARGYMERLIAHASSNPHYQDTNALILYKQGEHKKAHNILKQLLAKVPHDMIILKHYAKVCYALKDYSAASDALTKMRAQENNKEKQVKLDARITQLKALQKNG